MQDERTILKIANIFLHGTAGACLAVLHTREAIYKIRTSYYYTRMVGIVDYNAGNIKSVEHALQSLGVPYTVSKRPSELARCTRLIVPGVGEASYAMHELSRTGFDSFLKDWNAAHKPILGICLGSQIIFDYSEEGETACLGLVKGNVITFSSLWHNEGNAAASLKVPHMGWNDLTYANGTSSLLAGVDEHSDFYFVHSYVMQPEDASVVKAYTNYGGTVPAVIESGSVAAFQFHPEKSGANGLTLLANYCRDAIAYRSENRDAENLAEGERTKGGDVLC